MTDFLSLEEITPQPSAAKFGYHNTVLFSLRNMIWHFCDCLDQYKFTYLFTYYTLDKM